jgi:WD40 repeat protein/tRNA A-37 threonylcarbamoyl transferase component Bud32
MACLSIAFNGRQIFSGHGDATIRIRDLSTLAIIDTYRSHTDYVTSLCFDDTFTLYSASNDGSVKKWRMAARRIAFSFENRNDSVTALAAFGDQLFVGLRKGLIVKYSTLNASKFQSFDYHTREVKSLVSDGDLIYSAGLDGLIVQFSAVSYESFTVLHDARDQPLKSVTMNSMYLFALQEETKLVTLRKGFNRTISIRELEQPLVCITATDSEVIAGSRSGIIYAWNIENFDLEFELKGHVSQVNQVLIVDSRLFSASSDKAIIQWSLSSKNLIRVYERISASALGHLGPVNSISYCNGVLFSAGADLSVRRWNLQTGRNEEVYFGFSKPVTTVLYHNYSVFAGSEDFSVLMFKPNLPQSKDATVNPSTTILKRNTKQGKIVRLQRAEGSSVKVTQIAVSLTAVVFVITILIFGFIFYKKRAKKNVFQTKLAVAALENLSAQTVLDLATVVNSVMGISRHAAYLMENSVLAKIIKLTAGGGGEVFLAKIMDASLRNKIGEVVIQKVVFKKNTLMEEAFYQEVGIMILLKSFPHFCTILGYTEKPLSIVLKYYPDGSLYEWIRKTDMTKRLALKIVKEVSEALNVMHSHYLAHCDIKPQNVLVQVNNGIPSCYLTDFGITQVLSDRILAASTFHVANLRGLSIHYSAPESFSHFRSKYYIGADFKKYDVYSLACVLYETILQEGPWD